MVLTLQYTKIHTGATAKEEEAPRRKREVGGQWGGPPSSSFNTKEGKDWFDGY
jgi:hypothetical protein